MAAASFSGISCLVYGAGRSVRARAGYLVREQVRDALIGWGVDALFMEDVLVASGQDPRDLDFLRLELVAASPFDLIVAIQPEHPREDAPTLRGELHDLSWCSSLFRRVRIYRPDDRIQKERYPGFEAVVSRFPSRHVLSYSTFTTVEILDDLEVQLEEVALKKSVGGWPESAPPEPEWLDGVPR